MYFNFREQFLHTQTSIRYYKYTTRKSILLHTNTDTCYGKRIRANVISWKVYCKLFSVLQCSKWFRQPKANIFFIIQW